MPSRKPPLKSIRSQPFDPAIVGLVQTAQAQAAVEALELGERYRTGEGEPLDEQQALRWFGIGARLGNAAAQNNFGTMLLNGVGCPPDELAALHWFRAAAEQGHAVAQFNLGNRYLIGKVVEQDDRMAGDWFARSATQGHLPALCELGTLFRLGRGTDQDILQAAQLHLAAASGGHEGARCQLSAYLDELELMAYWGNREAAFDLHRAHAEGLCAAKSPALGWAWLRWAAEKCGPMPAAEVRCCVFQRSWTPVSV